MMNMRWWRKQHDSRRYLHSMGIVCILVHCERGRKRKMIYKNLKEIIAKHKEYIPVKALAELLADIDEAEAKQEEPCIWKWRILDKRKVFRNCLYREDTHIAYAFKYCPYCGKVRKEEPEV